MVFSKYTDLLPKEVLNEDTPELQRPDEEAVQEVRHNAMCYVLNGIHMMPLFTRDVLSGMWLQSSLIFLGVYFRCAINENCVPVASKHLLPFLF